MSGGVFRLVLILHLLGAAVWVGGHLVLTLGFLPRALRERDPRLLLDFESRYERIGIPALLVQVVTGLILAWRYLPDPAAWFSFESPVATHIFWKLALLALTLLLAIHARLRLIPRLDAPGLPLLAAHVVTVTVLAVLMVAVGAGIRTGGLF